MPLTVLMDGAECRHAVGWVVWSENQLAEGGPEGGPFVETVTSLHTVLEAPPITVAQRILPEEIILTNQDVPDLRGARAVPPPDVPATDVTVYNHGVSLAAGADKRWDASRQVRLKVINPANLDFIVGRRFYVSQEAYPNDETCGNVGNDDPDILSGEEDNDPYTSPWPYRVTGWDSPMYTPLQAVGQTGDTFEVRAHFRSFARVNIGDSWYRISDWYLWRVHFRFEKRDINGESVWKDNGSVEALDNEGF